MKLYELLDDPIVRYEKGGRLYLKSTKEEIGSVQFDVEKNCTFKKVNKYFEKDKKAKKQLLKLDLPEKFNYVYLDEIKLQKEFRGKGLGEHALSAAINSIPSPKMIALSPGEITKKVKFSSLKRFYTNAGFKVFRSSSDENFGFMFIDQ